VATAALQISPSARAAAQVLVLDARLERSWFHGSPLRRRTPDGDRMGVMIRRRERALRLFLYLKGVR